MKTTILSLFLCLSLLCGRAQSADPAFKTFESFWKKFHTAIMDKDFQRLSTFTAFPLVVKKDIHDTAVQTIRREDFAAFFRQYLDMPAGGDHPDKYAMLRVHKALTEEDEEMMSEDSATIEDFEFEKVDGAWKLVYIYATAGK